MEEELFGKRKGAETKIIDKAERIEKNMLPSYHPKLGMCMVDNWS